MTGSDAQARHGAHPCADLPSDWIRRWSHLIASGATVLDVACGSGRHVHWFAQRGCHVTGVDRNAQALAPLHGLAELVTADIERDAWPLVDRHFDAVIVTNYLWRPLLPVLIASVAPGGVLIYETFAIGQQTLGKPSNPDFLLQPGELLTATKGLRVAAYEDGFTSTPERFVQRIVAVRANANAALPARHVLG